MLFIHGVGAAQETANGSFPGKNTRGDPCNSIGGNEPRGRGPDGDYFQPRGPKVELPTGNMTFYSNFNILYIYPDLFIILRILI